MRAPVPWALQQDGRPEFQLAASAFSDMLPPMRTRPGHVRLIDCDLVDIDRTQSRDLFGLAEQRH
jgi:hypothetical protein